MTVVTVGQENFFRPIIHRRMLAEKGWFSTFILHILSTDQVPLEMFVLHPSQHKHNCNGQHAPHAQINKSGNQVWEKIDRIVHKGQRFEIYNTA